MNPIIPILMGNRIELEVDPNPNGLPVLVIQHWSETKLLSTALLSETHVKELVIALLNILLQEEFNGG